jgi:NAD+ kinase
MVDVKAAPVKTVGIFAKPNAAGAAQLVPELLAWLAARGIAVRLDQQTAVYAGPGAAGLPRREVPLGCDLAIVLGGDGTLLSAARAVGHRGVPLFAVNLGGLGFLTAITVDDLYPELERSLAGSYTLSRRKMLAVSHRRGQEALAEYQALNDVVVAKTEIARIVDLEAWAGDSFVCAYKADGLLIATPTGSTAYSLSAGGPIIYPTVNAICLTPICPHTLTNRPLIVPGDLALRIVCKGSDAFLTVDGQVGAPLTESDVVECRVSDFDVLLVRPPQTTFFDVLRQKLKWGER